MCTVPLPPGGNPISVDKYIISSKINEQRECSQNVETLILVTKYVVTAMCALTMNRVNLKET
jgi:hypothetical protein